MNRREFWAICGTALLSCGTTVQSAAEPQSDPWKSEELLEPKQLAGQLTTSKRKSQIIYVGFPVLYRAAHLPGALLAGPCSKVEGLDSLRKSSATWVHGSEVVLYCGCCPFPQCPNIRPAYRAVRELGFENPKVLYLPTNLHTDWILKGYPVDKERKA